MRLFWVNIKHCDDCDYDQFTTSDKSMLLKIFSQVIFFFFASDNCRFRDRKSEEKICNFCGSSVLSKETHHKFDFFLLLVFYKLKKSRGQKPFKTSALAQNGRSVIGRKFYDAHHSQISLCKR